MYLQLIKERKYWRAFFANNHDKRSKFMQNRNNIVQKINYTNKVYQ